MKYRKKPIIIEAMELNRRNAEMVIDFIGTSNAENYNLGEFYEDSCYVEIRTLEGIITAQEGDFVIKGINGEFYPCKPDIFKQTYDKILKVKE